MLTQKLDFQNDTISSLHLMVVALVLLFAANFSVAAEGDLEKEYINPYGTSFTNVVAVIANGVKTLYVSGQVGFSGNDLPEDFGQQVDNAFANLRQELEAAGAGLQDIVKTRVYIVDLNAEKVAAFSAVRAKYFQQKNQPASTVLGVSALIFPSLQVEIEVVAVLED